MNFFQSCSTESRYSLHGSQLGLVQIPWNIRQVILDKGQIRSQFEQGRRNVAKYCFPSGNELFFKHYPELPGLEYAVDKLFELLIGHGTSFYRFNETHITKRKKLSGFDLYGISWLESSRCSCIFQL